MKDRRPRRRGRFLLLAALFLFFVLSGWATLKAVVAANRHQLDHPGRSHNPREDGTAGGGSVSQRDLLALLSGPAAEGPAENGVRIALTIDEDLQKRIFSLFRRFDPPYGVFAAMEPATGRVVALVGYRRGGESDPRLPLKAIYPAASLIKVVTASAAIERGNLSPDDEISYRGGIYGITKKGIHAKPGRGTPTMSFGEAIAKSANSVFGKVAVNYVGSEVLSEYLAKFGFGEKIPFDLPVEPSQGEVPRDEFNLARTGAGFGEIYVSPLHVAMIMAAIGNSGEMPRPILVERLEDKDGSVLHEESPSKWRDTVRPETADDLLAMMVKTIEMGTSRRTFGSPDSTPLLKDMEVAGKTGSLSGWTPRVHFEWFAGVAPAGDPQLAVAALVVNDNRWKIKGSFVGREAFNTYFGYPESAPPVYAKGRGKARIRQAMKRSEASKKRGPVRKRSKKAPPGGRPAASSPRADASTPVPGFVSRLRLPAGG
jgi:cell division protein FtsI/penicillin-binding protein 2